MNGADDGRKTLVFNIFNFTDSFARFADSSVVACVRHRQRPLIQSINEREQ
jgi:hypothetical protein